MASVRRGLVLLLVLTGCDELGVSVQVSAASDVPALDGLQVSVTQAKLSVSQSFNLAGRPLPQSIAVVAKGLTRGTVNISVQGLAGGTVEAIGSASAELRSASSNPTVSIMLARACDGVACGCLPQTCPTGACGSVDDGCGGTLDCGSCDAGLFCNESVCAVQCAPRTCAAAGAACGFIDDGCGGQVDCGGCDGGSGACGGGGVANQCACRAACPANACDMWSDGCGGTLDCGATCPGAMTCHTSADPLTGGLCTCAPLGACGGSCVDLSSDGKNCGTCGHTCPGGVGCRAGQCACDSVAANADGHCCPPGWTFEPTLANAAPRCYLGPFDAGAVPDAIATCRAATLASFGRAVAAVGMGGAPTTFANNAVPQGACGSFLLDPRDDRIVYTTSTHSVGYGVCKPSCESCRTCTSCSCGSAETYLCEEPYFCVMDPLGPRFTSACSLDGDCAPGDFCDAGNCTSAGVPFCVVNSDCPGGGTCVYRQVGETGLCR